MTTFRNAFPSKYFQVADLDEGPVVGTIKDVAVENVGGENGQPKLVVHFEESELKGLVCNLTRAEAIAALAQSDDTDRWIGTTIRLVRGFTRFQKKRVPCILVEAAPNSSPTAVARNVAEVPF